MVPLNLLLGFGDLAWPLFLVTQWVIRSAVFRPPPYRRGGGGEGVVTVVIIPSIKTFRNDHFWIGNRIEKSNPIPESGIRNWFVHLGVIYVFIYLKIFEIKLPGSRVVSAADWHAQRPEFDTSRSQIFFRRNRTKLII